MAPAGYRCGVGLGFRVTRLARVRVSRRGARLSLGPRIARLHVGGGRTRVSSGLGPFFVISGRRRRKARRGDGYETLRVGGSGRAGASGIGPATSRVDLEEQAWRDRLAQAKARGPSVGARPIPPKGPPERVSPPEPRAGSSPSQASAPGRSAMYSAPGLTEVEMARLNAWQAERRSGSKSEQGRLDAWQAKRRSGE